MARAWMESNRFCGRSDYFTYGSDCITDKLWNRGTQQILRFGFNTLDFCFRAMVCDDAFWICFGLFPKRFTCSIICAVVGWMFAFLLFFRFFFLLTANHKVYFKLLINMLPEVSTFGSSEYREKSMHRKL